MAVLLALFVPRLGLGGAGGMLVTVAVIGILSAVAIPAYQQYTQKARVAAAYFDGLRAAHGVGIYYANNEEVPAMLGAAGVSAQPTDNKVVELIQLNPENAQVRVLTRIVSVHGQGVLTFAPSLDANKRITWKCSAQDLDPQALPPDCR